MVVRNVISMNPTLRYKQCYSKRLSSNGAISIFGDKKFFPIGVELIFCECEALTIVQALVSRLAYFKALFLRTAHSK